MLRARVCSVVITMTIAAQGAAAHAGEAGSAAALFDKGLQDMRASRYDSACPALAESYSLDARPGALFTLAECEARWGKLASARAHYDGYLQLYAAMPPRMAAGQRQRAEIARAQRAALAARVPLLTLVLPPAGTAGLSVRRDGIALGAPSLGVALPVDPGEHTIVVVAADGTARPRTVTLAAGDRVSVELASLVDTPVAAPPAPADRRAPPGAIAALSVGAAGLVVAGVTGGLALAARSTAAAHCAGSACDAVGQPAASREKTLGWVSATSLGVGLAAAATGVALWIVGTRSAGQVARAPIAPASWAIDHAGAFGVSGRF